jgi:small subunit ribosomal protein S8e
MTQWMLRSKRKATGGLYKRHGKKERKDAGRDFLPTHIGKKKVIALRTRGGGKKMLLTKADIANVSVKGKYQKAKIMSVLQNPADPHFVRRNIITKGAVIQTDLGKARVTSRPGQHGTINAVLVEEKKA